MSPNEYKASIDDASERFQKHLNEENNFRIIFSGKYGIGKSYFLNQFFNRHLDRYNKFTISPVNYVVSSNEDIFELIKVDLTMQLFQQGFIKKEEKIKVSKTDKIQWFVAQQPLHFFKFFTTAIKKINIAGVEIETDLFKALIELKESYDNYITGFEKDLETDSATFETFLNSFSEATGNIYESNFITQLINEKLDQARSINIRDDQNKENVLIIEDLDRIDPDHIFRIFNILSAHNNFFGEKNKFAFDKIILVCDIDNIKKIFEHRYGKDVDFNGYSDKFYSSKIYTYSNIDAIGEFIHSLELELRENDELLLKYLLITLVNNDLLGMRQLVKYRYKSSLSNNLLVETKFDYQSHLRPNVSQIQSFIYDGMALRLKTDHLGFLKVIDICSTIFGEFESFVIALKKLKEKRISYLSHPIEREDSLLESLAFPLHISNSLTENINYIFYGLVPNNNMPQTRATVYPRIRISKYDFTFHLIWNSNQTYKVSDTDYFLGMAIQKSNHSGDQVFDYVDSILKIVTTFHTKRILYNVGITTDY